MKGSRKILCSQTYKIESPFSAIDTPKKVVHVLQPIDGDRYEAR